MATNAKQVTAPDNMRIWSQVEKTDPAHTKPFQRAGGFKGTALKPMWVWQHLTEVFGPFGEGWGCDKPDFQLVPADKELLVYCTVSAWHEGESKRLWGVGGDKVVAMTKNGPRTDDEAFKKAFTDALMNAFKFIGVGADIHMGRFDDNKYVQQLKEEFTEAPSRISEDQLSELMTLGEKAGADVKAFCTFFKVKSVKELPADQFERARTMLRKKLNDKSKANPEPEAKGEFDELDGDEVPY